jgi:hypothetical protein
VKVHYLATHPHYLEHILAVWKHLPEKLKGLHLTGFRGARHIPEDDFVMVGGYIDIARAEGRRVVYVEHGAGQKYEGNTKQPGSYHGSEHPENVVAYISPRDDVAKSWGRPAIAAGAPVCDPYPLGAPQSRLAPPVAAITFHWDCKILPETRSALDHYAADLGKIVHTLRGLGFVVIGHHHPRDTRLPKMWRHLGVHVATVDQVRTDADVLIADNTSLAYEMLYLQRKVITLNAPWFRRDVEHGLRFWSHVPGRMVDGPDELIDSLRVGSWVNATSRGICEYVYGKWCSDGHDGFRAAANLTALLTVL